MFPLGNIVLRYLWKCSVVSGFFESLFVLQNFLVKRNALFDTGLRWITPKPSQVQEQTDARELERLIDRYIHWLGFVSGMCVAGCGK